MSMIDGEWRLSHMNEGSNDISPSSLKYHHSKHPVHRIFLKYLISIHFYLCYRLSELVICVLHKHSLWFDSATFLPLARI